MSDNNFDLGGRSTLSSVEKSALVPPSTAISSDQARNLTELMLQIVAIEQMTGVMTGVPKWISRFNKKFHTTNIDALPAVAYDSALKWLRNRLREEVSRLKRREALVKGCESRFPKYAAIKTKMRELDVDDDKTKFYQKVSQILGFHSPFTSLTVLSDKDLDKVTEFVAKLTAPLP